MNLVKLMLSGASVEPAGHRADRTKKKEPSSEGGGEELAV
jgi:hypothetical protein